jgi:rhamnogalacturonan endolyase
MSKKIKTFLGKMGAVLLSMQLIAINIPKQYVLAGTTETAPTTSVLRQMENLDRGLVAVKVDNGIFLSWRLLGTEDPSISFNVYRDGVKLNSSPITASTNYVDAEGKENSTYYIRAVLGGMELAPSETTSVWGKNYLSVPLQVPAGGTTPDGKPYTYNANDASVADLDGDGKYEIILKWDPSNSQDNSLAGYTGNVILDAYKMDGTRLWRIDLGQNIRAGAHYTQFMAYDLDGDGKAEIACKTADGTVDGKGTVIGDGTKDWRQATKDAGYTRDGYILEGPEFLTIFDGLTGAALKTTDYDPPRGATTPAEMQTMWGDNYGNRVDRFLGAVAYLDGVHPSLVMCRGYYTRLTMVAYNWKDGDLTKVWKFDSNDAGNSAFAGQGNHNLSIADVDNDGKDEIIYGSCAVNDDGTGMYTTGFGHGDAMHLGDLDPTRPGLELFAVHEEKNTYLSTGKGAGAEMHDPATGEVIWKQATTKDTGRGLSADIDPRYFGEEQWGSAGTTLHTAKGDTILATSPSAMNFAIWWDGDLSRELLDGTTISKWDYMNSKLDTIFTASDISSNNGTKANPSLQADILGDWREEVVVRSTDNSELRIYTTTAVTENRIYTLMHDPIYRLGIAWQNVSYNQPPHTSFYLGTGMTTLSQPKIKLVGQSSDATISGITVDGTALNGFAVDKTEYNVELPAGTTRVPEVAATATNGKANAVVTATTALPGATTVVVTAEDGTTKTYTINFTVKAAEPVKSNDATISGITVDGTALNGFALDKTEYNIELPAGTTKAPQVVATATNGKASAVVTVATALPGATTVIVTAEDGTTKTYKINFTVKTAEPTQPTQPVDPAPVTTPSNDEKVVNIDASTIVKAIEKATDKSTVTIDVTNNKLVGKEVFDSIKGTDKTLVFEQNGVQWKFNGKDIKEGTKNIDMTVKVASLADSTAPGRTEIADKVKNTDVMIVSFAENGLLPGKASVKVKMDSAWLNGKDQNNLHVYYYNSTTKKAELVASKLKVDDEGYVEFEITHNSDYFIADKDLVQGGVIPKTGSMLDINVLIALGGLLLISGIGMIGFRRNKKSK